MLAPICLFVYNRPDHTKKVLDYLSKNKESVESTLYIFSDGPPQYSEISLIEQINSTRNIIRAENRFKKVIIAEREKNSGLSKSIIQGVTEVLKIHTKVIVLEDDLLVSSTFLSFMNSSLEKYSHQQTIGAICGFMYPISLNDSVKNTFLLDYNSCWGWGTWEDRWELFDDDGSRLLNKITKLGLSDKFDFDNTVPHIKMLKNQISGINNSWAIRWAASLFVERKVSLFPKFSLVKNIGFDGSGIHSGVDDFYNVELYENLIHVNDNLSEEENEVKEKLKHFFKKLKIQILLKRIQRILASGPIYAINKILKRLK